MANTHLCKQGRKCPLLPELLSRIPAGFRIPEQTRTQGEEILVASFPLVVLPINSPVLGRDSPGAVCHPLAKALNVRAGGRLCLTLAAGFRDGGTPARA